MPPFTETVAPTSEAAAPTLKVDAPTTEAAEQDPPRPAISARAVTLVGPRGPVYTPLSLTAQPSSLTVFIGSAGSGRTSLLLTLAGRMKPTSAKRLNVLGVDLTAGNSARSQVQKRAAIAGFSGIDSLDGAITVGGAIRERRSILTSWWRRSPRVTQAELDDLAAPVFGDRAVPSVETLVWDLDELDLLLLRITIALIASPELLIVDDVDQVRDDVRRAVAWERLRALTATGLTIVTSAASLDEPDRFPAMSPDTVIELNPSTQL